VAVVAETPSLSEARAEQPREPVRQIKIRWGADEWQTATQSGHVNTETFVCVLCERQLPSLEKLQKHVQISQLHKDNFAREKERIMSTMTFAPLHYNILNPSSDKQIINFEAGERKATYRDRFVIVVQLLEVIAQCC
jgi:hypothetical protein